MLIQQIPNVQTLPPLSASEVLERFCRNHKRTVELGRVGSPSEKVKKILLGLGIPNFLLVGARPYQQLCSWLNQLPDPRLSRRLRSPS